MMIYKCELKQIRESRNLTIRKLADGEGVSRSSICDIENGKVDMKVSTLVILAKFLGCNLSDIIKF